MAVIPIVTGIDNVILRTQSASVKKIDKKIKKLVADMIESMIAAEGIGIAAPQSGVNLRIFIARLNFGEPNEIIIPMINPEFVKLSEKLERHEEGCLSIPGKFGVVERHSSATIAYTDLHGKKNTLTLSELNARIMQHETDHLNGTLIADKWTVIKKKARAE